VQPVRSAAGPVSRLLDPDDVGAEPDEEPAGVPREVVGEVEDAQRGGSAHEAAEFFVYQPVSSVWSIAGADSISFSCW